MLTTIKKEQFDIDENGVKLRLEINYAKGTVSFLDKDGDYNEFVFANRTRDYLGGWVKIFEALSTATKWADSRLKVEQEAQKNRKLATMSEIFMAINETEEK
jgi:hypothetical protein